MRVGTFCGAIPPTEANPRADGAGASTTATAAAAGGSLRGGDGLGDDDVISGTGSGMGSGATMGGGAGFFSSDNGVGGALSSVSEHNIIWLPLCCDAHDGTPVHEARRIFEADFCEARSTFWT